MSLEFVSSCIAFLFMIKTKKKQRMIPQKRGSMRVADTNSSISYRDQPIKIYLDYKIKKDEDIHFRVVTSKVDKRVKRNFNEFLDVENYLVEYVRENNRKKVHEVPIIDKKISNVSSLSEITQAVENKLKYAKRSRVEIF